MNDDLGSLASGDLFIQLCELSSQLAHRQRTQLSLPLLSLLLDLFDYSLKAKAEQLVRPLSLLPLSVVADLGHQILAPP